MPNLETDLTNAWNDTMAELTPEERKILAGATAARCDTYNSVLPGACQMP